MTNRGYRDPKSRVGPFWTAMREAERRIYRGAFEAANEDAQTAAALLQVTSKWFVQRSRYLGGVLPDDPINEPPKDTYEERPAGAPRRGRPPKSRSVEVADIDDDEDEGEDEEGAGADDAPAAEPGAEQEAS